MSASPAGQQDSPAQSEAQEAITLLRTLLDADPLLRGQTTVIPAPRPMGPSATGPSDHDRVRYRLRREDEVPALIRRLRGDPRGEPQPSKPTEPPTALATFREERRQICAISRIVCQVTSEVLLGLRPANQLNRWMDLDVQQKVQERAAVLADARRGPAGHRTPASPPERAGADRGATVPRPQPLRFGTVRAHRAARGAWEVSVVFGDATRIRACAMRLEAHRRRWRVVAMELG